MARWSELEGLTLTVDLVLRHGKEIEGVLHWDLLAPFLLQVCVCYKERDVEYSEELTEAVVFSQFYQN